MALLALDQGTTGSTALVLGTDGKTLGRATREFAQHFPQPGWVEHEPEQIWTSVVEATEEALRNAGVQGTAIEAVGITNQRETTLLWDRATSRHVHRAIVWQDRRTSGRCAELKSLGHEAKVKQHTGLVLDPYFSGTKLSWMLHNVDGAQARAEAGELAFGTVDTFLIWKLTSGESHVTDVTNASRTMLMGLETLRWDESMMLMLDVPAQVLPKIGPSAGILGRTKGFGLLPDGVPISGVAGDQQAALFGQACFTPGDAKCTYGTGAFVLANTGNKPVFSRFGLLSTVAWQLGDQVTYALEGASFIAGAAVQWLRDGLGVINKASEIEALARTVDSSDGVVFVPALSGLGAPYWDPEARGLIDGLTRGTTKAHLARATLEGIAHSVDELLSAMADDRGGSLGRMRVDGGAAANDLLMQTQSDLSSVPVERPQELESTARGAAMLAGIGAGIFKGLEDAAAMNPVAKVFTPTMDSGERMKRAARWKQAVARARLK